MRTLLTYVLAALAATFLSFMWNLSYAVSSTEEISVFGVFAPGTVENLALSLLSSVVLMPLFVLTVYGIPWLALTSILAKFGVVIAGFRFVLLGVFVSQLGELWGTYIPAAFGARSDIDNWPALIGVGVVSGVLWGAVFWMRAPSESKQVGIAA